MELFCLNGVCPFIVDDDRSSSEVYCSGGKVVSLQQLASGGEKELVFLLRMKIQMVTLKSYLVVWVKKLLLRDHYSWKEGRGITMHVVMTNIGWSNLILLESDC
jgi:hypothetical protein